MASVWRVLAVIGTRPELVKMAPVLAALRAEPARFVVRVLFSGQHRELLDRAATAFGIVPDVDLDLMRASQSPSEIVASVSRGVERELSRHPADVVVAQGDTATVLGAALGAFHERVPFAHVEAGLRTGDLASPFPEEGYRRLVGSIASLHFAPSARARDALLAEGVDATRVFLTGNTVVDALYQTIASSPTPPLALPEDARVVLVTLHRRESFGAPLARIVAALARLLTEEPRVHLVMPVHPNPRVLAGLAPLTGHPRAHLLAPLDYPPFVALLSRADLAITDSGGVQEEAPPLGVPVLVARETTERPEGVDAGCAELVGSDPERIVTRARALLAAPRRGGPRASPYGDGHAASRITAALSRFLEKAPLEDTDEVLPWAA